MKKLKQILSKSMKRLKYSLKRFPETLGISIVIVVLGIIMNHLDHDNDRLMEILGKTIMSLVLGLPLTAALKIVYERYFTKLKIRIIADVIAFLLLGVYYFMIPEDIDSQFIFRYAALNITLYFLFSYIPYYYKRKNYSLYVLTLITRFFVTYLYSIVLFLGIIAMVFTVDKLFVLNIGSKIYYDIFLVVAGIFAITYYLGSIPGWNEQMKVENYPNVLKVLFVYIVLPIISVYTVILYIYFAKIIITWEWPQSLVGNLVLWYGLISTIIIFFVYLLRLSNKWVAQFLKYFPLFIILPLVMMYFAIGIRIKDYGITVPRYFVIVVGLWVLGNMIYLNINKKALTSVIALSGIVLLLISSYTPINAYAVSLWSQNNRLESILSQYGMLVDDEIVRNEQLSEEQKSEVSEIINYIERTHSLRNINVLPEGFEIKDMEDIFGFEYTPRYSIFQPEEYINYYFNEPSVLDVSQYNYLIDVEFYNETNSINYDDIVVNYDNKAKHIEIIKGSELIYSKDMEELVEEYHNTHRGRIPEKIEDVTFIDDNSNVSVKMIISELHGIIEEESIELRNMRAKILLKLK